MPTYNAKIPIEGGDNRGFGVCNVGIEIGRSCSDFVEFPQRQDSPTLDLNTN